MIELVAVHEENGFEEYVRRENGCLLHYKMLRKRDLELPCNIGFILESEFKRIRAEDGDVPSFSDGVYGVTKQSD